MNISIKLDSFNKIYKEGENITGTVDIDSSDIVAYDHITAVLTGSYIIKNQKVSPPQNHIIKFYNAKQKLSSSGKLRKDQVNSFPLNINLESTPENKLIETYQGVVVTIIYELVINVSETKLSEPLKIHIFIPGQGIKPELKTKIIPYYFDIKPSSLEKIKIEASKIPKFLLKCHIENTNINISKELDGWVKIMECELPVKSLELQFVRNEKVTLSNGESLSEVSEIQNLQIADGDVIKGMEISLNMLFPRHFCCASIENKIVKLSFDINIILVLNNGFVITENVPLNCWRG